MNNHFTELFEEVLEQITQKMSISKQLEITNLLEWHKRMLKEQQENYSLEWVRKYGKILGEFNDEENYKWVVYLITKDEDGRPSGYENKVWITGSNPHINWTTGWLFQKGSSRETELLKAYAVDNDVLDKIKEIIKKND